MKKMLILWELDTIFYQDLIFKNSYKSGLNGIDNNTTNVDETKIL